MSCVIGTTLRRFHERKEVSRTLKVSNASIHLKSNKKNIIISISSKSAIWELHVPRDPDMFHAAGKIITRLTNTLAF